MLYEGAIRFLERSLTGFEKEDPAEYNETIGNNVLRAQEIINELNVSLNFEKGGEVAANLRDLYMYFDRRLTESNIKKEQEGIKEVINRLTVLRDAWATMLAQQGADTPQGSGANQPTFASAGV
jgi:flagellar protein FliS